MGKRIEKINELIKKELGQILLKEFEFSQDTLVTITRVETTVDLAEAKVNISVMPENKSFNILQILKRQIYDIQQILNRRLRMRPIPRIKFVEDKETQEAGKIEELLEKLKKGEK